jgi:hypothetical protein
LLKTTLKNALVRSSQRLRLHKRRNKKWLKN